MTEKVINNARKLILFLVLAIYVIPLATEVVIEDQILILAILGMCYIAITLYSISKIESVELKTEDRFFPYRSSYIGVDRWLFVILSVLLGVGQIWQGDIIQGTIVLTLCAGELMERIMKNKHKAYNLIFAEDRIIVNEDVCNEIMYDNISSIKEVNNKTFKVFLKEGKDFEIFNVNRIISDLRNEFIRELAKLQSVRQKSQNNVLTANTTNKIENTQHP